MGYQGPWWEWLKVEWPYSQVSLYERGNVFHFLLLMPAVVSPFVFPAVLIGVWRSLSPGQRAGFSLHVPGASDRKSIQAEACMPKLVAFIPLFILVVHS